MKEGKDSIDLYLSSVFEICRDYYPGISIWIQTIERNIKIFSNFYLVLVISEKKKIESESDRQGELG